MKAQHVPPRQSAEGKHKYEPPSWHLCFDPFFFSSPSTTEQTRASTKRNLVETCFGGNLNLFATTAGKAMAMAMAMRASS
jgi:hypothetical protein